MQPSHLDTTDFIKLLTSHQMALRDFLYSILPGCQDINDILQDTNVVLWEKMHTFKKGTSFKNWAFTVAKFKALRYCDNQRLQKQRFVFSDKVIEAITNAQSLQSKEIIDHKADALNQCLGKLSSKERDLISIRYAKNTTLEEHSSEIGLTTASMRVTLHRIRHKLRNCIQKRLSTEGRFA